jgi:hypothetical protein
MSGGQDNRTHIAKTLGNEWNGPNKDVRLPGLPSRPGTSDVEKYDPDIDRESTCAIENEEEAHDFKLQMKGENIDHPNHYNLGNIEVTDFIEDQAHLGWCRQNAIKYICRSGSKKSESKEQSILKAIYYLERELGYHRKEPV